MWSVKRVAMMAEEGAKPRLGRGLAALIGDFNEAGRTPARIEEQRKVPVEFLRPNPRNPRRSFGEAELAELAVSITQRGIIQPIVVRPIGDVPGTFEIVAGERRWRAAQRGGLDEVPVVVVEIDDRASLEFAILENVQRSDLNAIEEASGYERLMQDFSYTQKELAEILGKSRSHLANTLRLLNLPASVQARVSAGELTAGHARALLAVRDPEVLARRVVAEGLSVRDVEAIASAEAEPTDAPVLAARASPPSAPRRCATWNCGSTGPWASRSPTSRRTRNPARSASATRRGTSWRGCSTGSGCRTAEPRIEETHL